MDANILVRTTSVVSYLVLPVRENCIVEESRRRQLSGLVTTGTWNGENLLFDIVWRFMTVWHI